MLSDCMAKVMDLFFSDKKGTVSKLPCQQTGTVTVFTMYFFFIRIQEKRFIDCLKNEQGMEETKISVRR